MKRYSAAVLFLALLAPALGEPVSPDRATLKGLKQLYVEVERVDAEAREAGLSPEQLKADVEARLRRAHVKVSDSVSDPSVYVAVTTLKLSTGLAWAFSIHVGLNQGVILVRDKDIACNSETWYRAIIGVVPSRDLVSKVREQVGEQVDNFIGDYLAANSAERPIP